MIPFLPSLKLQPSDTIDRIEPSVTLEADTMYNFSITGLLALLASWTPLSAYTSCQPMETCWFSQQCLELELGSSFIIAQRPMITKNWHRCPTNATEPSLFSFLIKEQIREFL